MESEPLTINVTAVHPGCFGKGIRKKVFVSTNHHPSAIRNVHQSWVPLESNPELLNTYLNKLGATGCQFTEIFGFDEELLAFIPQPVLAVMLCFPITEASEQFRHNEEKRLATEGQLVGSSVYHMKQTIGNACGTIAMLHCVMNHTSAFQLQDGKFWSNFYRDTKGMDAEQRASALNDNEDIEEEHQYVASQGGSSSSHPINDNLHFIVFSAVDGQLYEFDGRKQRPINHGPCDNVLYGSVSMIRRFMEFAPGDVRFNAVAMVPN